MRRDATVSRRACRKCDETCIRAMRAGNRRHEYNLTCKKRFLSLSLGFSCAVWKERDTETGVVPAFELPIIHILVLIFHAMNSKQALFDRKK